VGVFWNMGNSGVDENVESKVDSPLVEHANRIARMSVQLQYREQNELMNRWGEKGFKRSIEDAEFNVSVLREALLQRNQLIFLEHVRWLDAVLVNAGVPKWVLSGHLRCLLEVVKSEPMGELELAFLNSCLSNAVIIVESP
jgi:hypothetical protein